MITRFFSSCCIGPSGLKTRVHAESCPTSCYIWSHAKLQNSCGSYKAGISFTPVLTLWPASFSLCFSLFSSFPLPALTHEKEQGHSLKSDLLGFKFRFCCVALSRQFIISEPQSPHLWNASLPRRLLGGVNEVMPVSIRLSALLMIGAQEISLPSSCQMLHVCFPCCMLVLPQGFLTSLSITWTVPFNILGPVQNPFLN